MKINENLVQSKCRGSISIEQLVKASRAGNKDALNALCGQNQKFVMKYAAYFTGRYGNSFTTEDLMSAGNEGLMKTIAKFDGNRDSAFFIYAFWLIRQSILHEIVNNGYPVRISQYMHEKIRKITRMESELAGRGLSRRERISAIARALGNSEDQIMKCIQLRQRIMKCASLDMPVDEESDAVLGDIVPADRKDSPEDLIEQKCLKNELLNALHMLNDREEQIIIRRYGLDGMGERTLEEIGREMGVTRVRIHQIEKNAMAKLRQLSSIHMLKEYLEVA